MQRGDTPVFTMNIVNYAGAALDITDVLGIWFTAKNGYGDDEDAIFQKTMGDGITVVNAPLGELNIELVQSDTDTLRDEIYTLRYDVQIKDASAKVYTVDHGFLRITPDVTRSTV